MIFDLDAIAKRAADLVADRLLAELPGVVRGVLEERSDQEMLDLPQLAKYFGCKPSAMRMRLRRGSPLAALAVEFDGRQLWPRRAVEGLVSAKGARARLRVVP